MENHTIAMNRWYKYSLLQGCCLLVWSCSTSPEPINFGKDHCVNCKMKIVDPRFGGELVSSKGRVFKFDAIECLVPYLQEHASTDYAQVLAIAYDRPETLVDVQELVFERDSAYRSPMGGNLAAFTQAAAKEGKWMDWEEVKQTIGSPPNSTNY